MNRSSLKIISTLPKYRILIYSVSAPNYESCKMCEKMCSIILFYSFSLFSLVNDKQNFLMKILLKFYSKSHNILIIRIIGGTELLPFYVKVQHETFSNLQSIHRLQKIVRNIFVNWMLEFHFKKIISRLERKNIFLFFVFTFRESKSII